MNVRVELGLQVSIDAWKAFMETTSYPVKGLGDGVQWRNTLWKADLGAPPHLQEMVLANGVTSLHHWAPNFTKMVSWNWFHVSQMYQCRWQLCRKIIKGCTLLCNCLFLFVTKLFYEEVLIFGTLFRIYQPNFHFKMKISKIFKMMKIFLLFLYGAPRFSLSFTNMKF